jgi:hypothetical protein
VVGQGGWVGGRGKGDDPRKHACKPLKTQGRAAVCCLCCYGLLICSAAPHATLDTPSTPAASSSC